MPTVLYLPQVSANLEIKFERFFKTQHFVLDQSSFHFVSFMNEIFHSATNIAVTYCKNNANNCENENTYFLNHLTQRTNKLECLSSEKTWNEEYSTWVNNGLTLKF
jgi:hypothetical protein